MTITQWFIFFLLLQVIHFAGTWKLYIKAGRKSWEALIPVYNAVILMKIINRPWWWVILLFIPIINLIMFPVVWVETIRSYGRNSTADTWLAVLTLGFYIYYINYALDVKHIEDRSLKPRTATGEWISSILFAVIAATLVHTYFMQPFVIPTSSLEKTLLVGDFLFVSKFHYGARTPMTTVAFPMVHDTIPVIKTKSYLDKPQLPYFRMPGLQDIKRNDIVVFNWPTDTVEQFFKITHRKIRKPIDKKSNYVKRCVGLPGDSLSIKDGYIFINGEQNQLPGRAKLQFSYYVQTTGELTPRYMYERYGVTGSFGKVKEGVYFFSALTQEAAEQLEDNPNVVQVQRNIEKEGTSRIGTVFPNDPNNYPWNQDQFGPIYIPQAGQTVELNPTVLPLYKRIIERYEGNTIQQDGDLIRINGQVANTYTFKQDYYWMMGDNRHASEDSRFWGFVPEDHIVGKPVFIWMSFDSNASGPFWNKIRWERVFTTVSGDDQPRSYLVYFLIAVGLWYGYSVFRKRKNPKS